MAEIGVSTEELRRASGDLNQSAGVLEDEINRMTSRLSNMRSMWTGDTSNRFDDKWREWERSSQQLKNALDDVSRFLTTAAQTYEDAETRNKTALG